MKLFSSDVGLFDADPGEHTNLAASQPDLWHKMMARLLAINGTFFAPDRGGKDPKACIAATGRYKGFWGPWLDLPGATEQAHASTTQQ